MDAVTYPNENVVEFVNANMIPLRVPHDAVPHAKDFNVTWTPTVITIDPDGREHDRSVGFLAPDELVPQLMLGIAKEHFNHERFDETLPLLEKLLIEYPTSDAAPEAVYLRGVSNYKATHDAAELKKAQEQLDAKYPNSEWARRASVYKLL